MGNRTQYRKEQFIEKQPESNVEWAAQVIINRLTDRQFMELQDCFSFLEEALYKSWGKQMTFEELKEAIEMVAELSKK